MSNIDAQIKALQLKKKKIDYVSYVADLIKNDTKCIDFSDVQKEVVEKIEPFLLQLMESIEKDTCAPPTVETVEIFSKDEANFLKALVARAINKPPPPAPNSGGFNPDVSSAAKPASQLTNSDKMNFAMNHRHLGGKRVQILNDQNAMIFGTVVGLDAPHVQVKTETGPTINVPVEKVVPA